LTSAGTLIGTPLYMAPEQLAREVVGPAADVYALGLVLYELLSGRLPHHGLRGTEFAEAVQTRDPPPIRALCPTVPQALADLVDRAIQRRREERFQSAQEVRESLEAIRALYQPFGAAEAAMTGDDDAFLITRSFTRIAPRGDEFCARVYQRLFTACPELRPLFRTDMTAQRRKLLGALMAVVDNLQAPGRLIPLLEDLGRRHAGYGVTPDSFDALGAALLGAIADFDDQLDESCAAAWRRAYAQIAQAMQRGLATEQVTVPPGVRHASSEPDPTPTRYARSGDVGLAYQVVGNGAIDLVVVTGWLTHLEAAWQWPPLARFLRQLAGLGRLIVFDGRGTGLSDPGPAGPLLEDRAADLRAVLDAAGAQRAALIGLGEGAATTLVFAATHPERTRALVLYGASARTTAGDGHPHGASQAQHDEMIARIRTSWGEPLFLERLAPSMADDRSFRDHWARHLRAAAGPGAAIAHHRAIAAFDVRPVLPAIRVPVLVLHRDEDAAVPIAAGRALAEHIPDARFAALSGRDHLPFVGDGAAIVELAGRFLAEAAPPPDTGGWLAAVVAFAERGEARITDAVREVCEREVARVRGVELCGPGDGRAAAMFEGPGRAVRFAHSVLAQARSRGVELAAGVSFDTCRFGDADVGGDAVRLAPAIAAQAAAGEVLICDGARALLHGAVRVAPRGELPGEGIELHAVITGDDRVTT
jgi:pimeloyl-ACP methyl ester carboxylesterase/hemoglobin-like flavoprotein